jgi:hypothetical protein
MVVWLCWCRSRNGSRGSCAKLRSQILGTICSPRVMMVIVLAAVGLLACGFFLFVLFQWSRDTKRKHVNPTAVDDKTGDSDKKDHPQAAALASTKKQQRSPGRSRRVQSRRSRARSCGLGCNECERAAYEKVARSLRSGKRT